MQKRQDVAVYKQRDPFYSTSAPYHPPTRYPEYILDTDCDPSNQVYSSLRHSLQLLGLDIANLGTALWNPLGHLIHPGDTVLLKPNMIAPSHKFNDDWEYVITHGSVLRALVDYVYIALGGNGTIIIADAPQPDSDIDLIKAHLGIDSIRDIYWTKKKFDIQFLDLRTEHSIEKDGVVVGKLELPGDPFGNVTVDLGKNSFFAEQDLFNKCYYGASYDIDETNRHHSHNTHEYMISRTVLQSDVFISVPKLKTHKKVGVTLNLKGLVGINGNKNWLPHYAIGSPHENGDQFAARAVSTRLENQLVIKAKRLLLSRNPMLQLAARRLRKSAYMIFGDTETVVRSGNWHGNDTCWRMVLDLNRILLYANPDGTLRETPKRYFSVVDGIMGMEGNGPVAGKPTRTGLLISGFNPLAIDLVCTRLIGFDYLKIPMLFRAFDVSPYPFATFSVPEIYLNSNIKELQGNLSALSPECSFKFEPHFGWKGCVEL